MFWRFLSPQRIQRSARMVGRYFNACLPRTRFTVSVNNENGASSLRCNRHSLSLSPPSFPPPYHPLVLGPYPDLYFFLFWEKLLLLTTQANELLSADKTASLRNVTTPPRLWPTVIQLCLLSQKPYFALFPQLPYSITAPFHPTNDPASSL